MNQTIITNGSRAAVITQQAGSIWCNLYVNARNGLENASICPSRWESKTMKGAQNWAAKMLGL